MSYGPNFSDQYRRAAELVDKILHGTNQAISQLSSQQNLSWY